MSFCLFYHSAGPGLNMPVTKMFHHIMRRVFKTSIEHCCLPTLGENFQTPFNDHVLESPAEQCAHLLAAKEFSGSFTLG